ncbi:MAG TPA: 6-phosphogluconolactonase, partial [Chthoniobacterales bacterium]
MAREILRTKKFVHDAADIILDAARSSVQERGEFRIALSGGNTPRPVYSEIAARLRAEVSWQQILFTFSDERCVPPDDPQSNYRMARESLFDAGRVPPESILRMRGEIDPAQAATEYEKQLDER